MRIGDFEIPEPLPELKDPHVLAVLRPWIDVGRVGTISLRRIERHLNATEIGRLERPGRYYDFTRYRPRTRIRRGKREYRIPSTTLKAAVRENGPDLVTLHLLEPHAYGEDFTDSVNEVLDILGAKRYSLLGAMYDMVPPHPAAAGVGGDPWTMPTRRSTGRCGSAPATTRGRPP